MREKRVDKKVLEKETRKKEASKAEQIDPERKVIRTEVQDERGNQKTKKKENGLLKTDKERGTASPAWFHI